MKNYPQVAQTFCIINAAEAVHKQLGHHSREQAYRDALEKEFKKQSIPFEVNKRLKINNGGTTELVYLADFVCYRSIIIELKALHKISKVKSQLAQFLKVTKTGLQKGLLLNFGAIDLQHRRFVTESISYI
ncbi:MAG: GxxExxY protein [Verrucomicrobiota bacterium]